MEKRDKEKRNFKKKEKEQATLPLTLPQTLFLNQKHVINFFFNIKFPQMAYDLVSAIATKMVPVLENVFST